MNIFKILFFAKAPACPYCKTVLTALPKRKTVCKQCGNKIFVRSKQKIFPHQLLKENEAKVADWIRQWEQSGTGITTQEFLEIKRSLPPNDPASFEDIVWSAFQKKNLRLMKSRDANGLRMLNYEMALFLHSEGRNHLSVLEIAHKYDLMRLRKDGCKKVQILTRCGESCSSCQKLHGKILSIEEAKKAMPIPCKECSHLVNKKKMGFCRCLYVSTEFADVS